jgi:ABC-type transport system involved in multi-copper enzyme maturation permease subunit
MSPLLRKEIRLLLPYWAIAIVLAVVSQMVFGWEMHYPYTYEPQNPSFVWAFGFGMVLLGLAPFGGEFSMGTFSALMVQPIDRQRIWRLKILLAGIAALSVLLVFEGILAWRTNLQYAAWNWDFVMRYAPQHPLYNEIQRQGRFIWEDFWHTSAAATVVLLVAITGGFWTTLLFRQTGASLWIVILVPGIIGVILEPVSHLFLPWMQTAIVLVTYAVYVIAGFLWARRLFERAEDSQWLGETTAVLSLKRERAEADVVSYRRRRVLSALVRKELQSHQISFVIAFGLLALHICTLIFRGVHTLPTHSELLFTLQAVPYLWLLMPWLMGCVAIAEERKLGTMEGQLCLPVTRRRQFLIKVAVVLVIGLVIAGFVPGIVETVGVWAGVPSEIMPKAGSPIYESPMLLEMNSGLITFQIAALLIGLVSIFASSLTRNTLHALGAAMVFGLTWTFVFSKVNLASHGYGYSWWKGPLIFLIGLALAVLATIALSFGNYKRLHTGGRVWLRNVAILFCTLVVAGFATAVVYQRPWELFMTVEPQHGTPVLSGAVRPMVAMPGGRMCALLPDGRIWISTDYEMRELDQVQEPWSDGYFGNTWSGIVYVPRSGVFVGSNWVSLAASDEGRSVEAIRSDGTLWSILSFADITNARTGPLDWLGLPPNPRQIGTDSDWKTVVPLTFSFVAVKTNGTLWEWSGLPDNRWRNEPKRLGNDSDWDNVFSQMWGSVLVKRDGSVWIPPVEPGVRMGLFVPTKLKGQDWIALSGAHNTCLVLKRDGSLWQWIDTGYPMPALGFRVDGYSLGLYRRGRDSDWMAISGFPQDFVAVKGGRIVKDGWVPFSQSLGRLSGNSDWLTIDTSHDQTIALATDGTLCMWIGMPRSRTGYEWLARSRRPFLSLNILSSSKN